jgi:hypothetical protein
VTDFQVDEANFFCFLKKKIQNGRLKKSEFFKIANSQYRGSLPNATFGPGEKSH